MPRIQSCFVLAAVLVMVSGGAAWAAPSFPIGSTGEYYAFGEIGSDYNAAGEYGFLVGSGFAMNEDLTVGVQIEAGGGRWGLGGFLDYAIKPLAFNIDVRWAFPGLTARVDGLYLLDVKPVKAGVGVGALYNASDILVFVEGTAGYELSRGLNIYAAYEYVPSGGDSFFRLGAAYTF